jgi:hypothetical protein
VPVLWRQPEPFGWLRRSWWRERLAELRGERRSRTRRARTWLGLPHGSPNDRRETPAAATPPSATVAPPSPPAADRQ